MGCTKVLFLIAQIVFSLLGALLIAIGAWVWATVGAVIAWMPIIIVFAGVIVIIVCVLGCLGCGYDKSTPDEHKFKKMLMLIHFFVFLVVDLAIAVASTLCLVAWEKVLSIVQANLPQLIEIAKTYWPNDTGIYTADYIAEKCMSNLKVVGGIGVAVACVFVLGLVLAGFILGYEAVFTHTLTFGNLILAAGGGCLIAFGIFVYATGLVDGKGVPLAIGLIGVVIVVIAVVGFVASCCQQKSCCQCFLCMYAVILLLLLVAAIVLGIVVAAFTDTVVAELDTLCQKEEYMASVCMPIFALICDTAMGCNATSITPSDIITALKSYVTGNMYMVATGAIWIGAGMFYLIVAALVVRGIKPRDGAKKESIAAAPSANATPTYGNTPV